MLIVSIDQFLLGHDSSIVCISVLIVSFDSVPYHLSTIGRLV